MILLLGSLVVHAGQAGAQEARTTVAVFVDNDYFVFWRPPQERTDTDFTHGTRVSWTMGPPESIKSSALCRRSDACGLFIEFGQELYTPGVEGPSPVPGERPFAGWLYSSVTASSVKDRRYRGVELTLGVTGPVALAEESQEWLHRAIPKFRRPVGWGNQLSTELAFAVVASQSWGVPLLRQGSFAIIGVPEVAVGAGTLRSSLGTGVRVRAGYNVPDPWRGRSAARISLVAFAGLKGELLANSLFLSGNTYRGSVRVDPSHALGEWERGIGVRLGSLSIEHRVTTRTREYRAGAATHSYGSIGMMWSPR